MTRRLPALAILILLSASSQATADGPPSKRVVEGRVVDAEGKPVRQGKVMFAPSSPGVGLMLSEASSTTIDDEGHYRIEIQDFPAYGPNPLLATGPLKYVVLSPGFKQMVGTVEAGVGPSTVDVKLEAQPWKTTDLVVVDRQGKPVPDAEVTVAVNALAPLWSKLKTDAEGRCRIEMAPDQAFGASIRREGSPILMFALRGISTDPSGIRLTLLEPIRGRVVDVDGKPVAGVSVGGTITRGLMNQVGPETALKVRPFPGLDKVVITDEDGRFVMSPTLSINPLSVDASGEFRRPPLRLTFADAAVNRIAWGDVDLNAPASALEVTLRSTRPVSVPIQYASGVSTESVKIFWSLGAFVASGRPPTILSAFQDARKSGEGDLVELNCPPGKYRFQVTMQDMSKGMMAPRLGMADVELTVPEGTGAFEAPPARLADPAQQQMIGRAAPEIEATDLDTGQAVKLADFRGKVVVLDFWGYWCGPCVSTMPELAEIQRHFEGKPVVILALHDPTVQSKEEYDRQIKGVKKLLWGDKDIPLQVILDRADPNHGEGHPSVEHGLTIRRYQVRTVPTLFVIDQEGKINGVVHFRDHDGLKARIQGLLDKPPAR